MRILITGATGNVGRAVVSALTSLSHEHQVCAGVRRVHRADTYLDRFPHVHKCPFDFDDIDQFPLFLKEVDVLFLLRPPHISDVKRYFAPLIAAAKAVKVVHIVFLSVQGVEKSSIIPHHKIERLIRKSGLSYTFLRPAYFMQNFSTALRNDVIENDSVFLPAGNAMFNLVDVEDVGQAAARVLINPTLHEKKAYDLTNGEQMDFKSMCSVMSGVLGRKIQFNSPNLIAFFIRKRKEGVDTAFILVMIMLHYLPRFQKAAPKSNWLQKIMGRQPLTFKDFVVREQQIWQKL
nr:NAD(P)H-binding protein [Cytophagales bacterium]